MGDVGTDADPTGLGPAGFSCFAYAATTAEASRLAAARHARRHPHHRRRPALPSPRNHSTRTRQFPDGRHQPGSASAAGGHVRPIPRTLTGSATTCPPSRKANGRSRRPDDPRRSPHSPHDQESQTRSIRTNDRYHSGGDDWFFNRLATSTGGPTIALIPRSSRDRALRRPDLASARLRPRRGSLKLPGSLRSGCPPRAVSSPTAG